MSGDPEALAAFSSRGPCDDRRIKPDLVAPGTDILSTRSSTAPADHYWGLHANNRYAYMRGGTSMASPLAAGCAALVREYFVTERGIFPSAALLKAALINGTRWLTSSDSIADHGQQPNYHQGFGEIHLPTTLPSAAEPTLALEFVDTWQTPAQQLKRTGDMIRYTVTVNQGRPLRLCLAYTDLPARALQNDLACSWRTRLERNSRATSTFPERSPAPTWKTTSKSSGSMIQHRASGGCRYSPGTYCADPRTSPSWPPERSSRSSGELRANLLLPP